MKNTSLFLLIIIMLVISTVEVTFAQTSSTLEIDLVTYNQTNLPSLYQSSQSTSFNENFTAGQRWGTWGLNWLIPGLGSFVIMNDNVGGGWLLGLGITGIVLTTVGMYFPAGSYDAEGNLEINQAAFNTGMGIMITGVVISLAGGIFNIVRSITYNRPNSLASVLDPEVFQVSLIPGKNGIEKVAFAYTFKF